MEIDEQMPDDVARSAPKVKGPPKVRRISSNQGILIKKSTMIIQNLRELEELYEVGDKLGSGSYGIIF